MTEIPGIVFQYTAGRLDNLRSIAAGFHFRGSSASSSTGYTRNGGSSVRIWP